jgi:hypothetical protein
MKTSGLAERLGLAASLVAMFLFAATASAFAGTLDQQQTMSNTEAGLNSGQGLAQTFTAGITGDLDQADLLLRKVDSPVEPLTVEIRNAAGGQPGTAVLASASIPMSALGSGAEFVSATFDTPAAVTAGTQYALVAYTAHATNDCCGWAYQDATNPYAGGAGFNSNTFPPLAPWGAQGGGDDYAFRTYVVPQGEPTPPEGPAPPESPPGSGAVNAATQHIAYTPFNAAGKIVVPAGPKKKGKCFSQSLEASRPGVVRCLRNDKLLDPCFRSPRARRIVVCVYSPSSVAVRLKVHHVPKTRRPYLHNAWAVTVAAGECPLIAGATAVSPYGRLNYACPGNLALFGDPIPANPDWVIWAGYDPLAADAHQIPISTVWY